MTRTETLRRIDGHEMRLASGGGRELPVEQTQAWDNFDRAMGREPWGRYVYEDNGKPVAVIALTEYTIGGQKFLWAKHGPVWLKEQSPEREAHLRRLLVNEVRSLQPEVAFIRMHARYSAPDCHELLNSLTYDRTYVIDLRPKTPEAIAAAMPKDGRRAVKRAARVAEEAGCSLSDESDISREDFDAIYGVMLETAERDGFTPHPIETYWNMLQSLGREHARLFVLRYEGQPHVWVLCVTSGVQSVAYYGASTYESRKFRGAEALDWYCACVLAEEGYEGYDLMGAGSTRVPELYSVGQYKKRYAQHVTEVDGAWDVPVNIPIFAALLTAKKGKHLVRGAQSMALQMPDTLAQAPTSGEDIVDSVRSHAPRWWRSAKATLTHQISLLRR
ncbi:lipid II:glycine glycyltransferase FemX [Actinomyces vulturis]|uniref:lipid II:glycine glycyltransferase FemX n=1 Tax=Actinomyces vulturis TaxID=1857645 RepID=UPI00082E7A83|nr:GNAT family N-acetyltransferase [Actinomyces vulturis]